MSESIGKIQMDLETNYAPFQQQLNNISGTSTNMVTQAFGKMGKVLAGAFAVKKLIDFGKASIDMASDLAEVQNVVDVVFGESSSTINNFAKNAITQYGLSELSAKRYSSTMGAMLKSMGLSEDAVLGMSQSITALAGDMASFYNLSSDDAFNKIRAGISGETEPLKQLGINMSQANLEAFALSQGITKSVQSMTQSEQALLRYKYLLSVTSDAQGDFARTSDSWANQTRILSEQWNSFKASMGTAFIAVLTPVVKLLNWVVSKLQVAASYFRAFIEALTGTQAETEASTSTISDGLSSITDEADATAEAATKASKALAGFDKLNVLSSGGGESEDVGSMLGDISMEGLSTPAIDTSATELSIKGIEEALEGVKGYFQTSFGPALKSWGDAFAGLKTPIKNAFSNITTSTKKLWNSSLKPFVKYVVGDYVPSIVNAFSKTMAPIFKDVMSVAVDEYAKNFEFRCWAISSYINDILMPAYEAIKNAVVDTMEIIKTAWDNSGQALLDGFQAFTESIRNIIQSLYENVLKPIWDTIIESLTSLWDNHLKGLMEKVVGFFMKLGQCALELWNDVLAPIVNWLIETFGPIFVNIFQGIWQGIKTAAGNIIDALGFVFDALGGLLDFIVGVFKGDWERAWEGIKSFFKNIWDAMVTVVKAPINLIIGFINALLRGIVAGINLAIKGLNMLSFTVPDWVPVIGGSHFGFNIPELTAPQIPMLARGGIIDQPTLAMVGEKGKEAVVPLENTAFADSIANAIMRVLMPLFANNNGNKQNNNGPMVVVLKVGEYELGRVSVGAINKYHDVIGKVELEV